MCIRDRAESVSGICVLDTVSYFFKALITGEMSVIVVYLLEIIHVEDNKSHISGQ